MTDNEIREAIERIKSNGAFLLAYYYKDVKVLIKLAEAYLACSGVMPNIKRQDKYGGEWRDGYNYAIDECTLALTKLNEGLEDYMELICEAVHKAYCEYNKEHKKCEYWTKGDYSLLTEEGKEYDRRTVRAVLGTIRKIIQNPNLRGSD